MVGVGNAQAYHTTPEQSSAEPRQVGGVGNHQTLGTVVPTATLVSVRGVVWACGGVWWCVTVGAPGGVRGTESSFQTASHVVCPAHVQRQ